MRLKVVDQIRGNRREIPGNLPPGEWWARVRAYETDLALLGEIPWWHDSLEVLTSREMRRVKAKALIWFEVTGKWPREIAWWWEIRQARRRGDLPHTRERVAAAIDAQGVAHCGCCEARWSGPNHPERCKLCDRLLDYPAAGVKNHGID